MSTTQWLYFHISILEKKCDITRYSKKSSTRLWKFYYVHATETPMNFRLVCHYLFINNHAKKAFIICLYHTRSRTYTHSHILRPIHQLFTIFRSAVNEFFTIMDIVMIIMMMMALSGETKLNMCMGKGTFFHWIFDDEQFNIIFFPLFKRFMQKNIFSKKNLQTIDVFF